MLLKLANHALDFGVEVPLKYHGNAILSAWVRLQPELAGYYRNSDEGDVLYLSKGMKVFRDLEGRPLRAQVCFPLTGRRLNSRFLRACLQSDNSELEIVGIAHTRQEAQDSTLVQYSHVHHEWQAKVKVK